MLTKNEVITIIVITLVLGFVISLMESMQIFFYTSLFVFLTILINLIAKKSLAFYYDAEIETKIWEIRRYGYRKGYHFKKPIPAGVIFPLITTVFSLGYITWMASMVFEIKTKVYKAAKRHGLYKFTEMTEDHLAYIASAGVAANILLGIIGYLLNYPQFAQLNLYYAFFQMIPFSNLDGNKIFFGSLALWSFLAVIVLIGLIFAIFVI
ncbi:hypothetical protein CMI44_00405 [Candidatus Pacearchaeota archaeon]|jgi:hypothetical protein|nr:hypothetical protein [Candidatus Pacearchaeota archaeon]|tara:strand:+ start:1330 stop:1956 length:627 start_codon:yes stop_codon:yes gene_type:complete